MNKNYVKYANRVAAMLPCDKKTRKRVKEDVIEMLMERSGPELDKDPVVLLGSYHTFAEELAENMGLQKHMDNFRCEYVSSISIFGLPLYHIITRSGYGIAKGIIAIGPLAVGGIAIGGVTSAKLMLYKQSFIEPNDPAVEYYTYNFQNGVGSFIEKFHTMGPVKKTV